MPVRPVRAVGRAAAVAGGTLVALFSVGCGTSSSDTHTTKTSAPPAAAAGATVHVGAPANAQAIPSGFVGLSIEFRTLDSYAGTNPHALNPVFVQLMRNLAPGQPGQLRIGGDTTDWTWYPYGNHKRPLGVRYDLTGRWFAVARALEQALNARAIVGINLEANNTHLSAVEARAVLRGLGSQRIEGLEIGNEPELYGSFAWYQIHGVKTFGRPHAYNFNDFLGDYARTARALPTAPLAGPNTGGVTWMPYLNQFLNAEHGIRVATLHRYPLKRCSKSIHLTIGQLLSSASSQGLADSVARYARTAHSHHVPLRIDEMNSVSCGGQPGVSDTYATALWSVDAMFQMARVGVDGVNIHSRPGVSNQLFTFAHARGRWSATVSPVYYGLTMFAAAAPPGSRLLQISGASNTGLQIWATRAPDRKLRVVLINKDPRHGRTVALALPNVTGAASVARLRGPNLAAKRGVTFGGQGYGTRTTSGVLAGAASSETIDPTAGSYVVKVPAASAALLTLAGAAK